LLAAPPSGHDVRVFDVSGVVPGWLTAPAELSEGPGRHDFTAWRDALDPPLARLLGQVAS
jgi:hypothetical protein